MQNSKPEPSNEPTGNQPPDPFRNLDSPRLPQDFATAANVKPVLTTVAVRKPNKHEFVRVRPGEEWRFQTGTFTQKDSRETYLVAPDLWSTMPGEIQPTLLVLKQAAIVGVFVSCARAYFERAETFGVGFGGVGVAGVGLFGSRNR